MADNQSTTDQPTRHIRQPRRSLRTTNAETPPLSKGTPSIVSNAVGDTTVKQKKRKKQSKSESDEDPSVPVGKTTSRERLLDLLNRRFQPKKPRLSAASDKKTTRAKKASQTTRAKATDGIITTRPSLPPHSLPTDLDISKSHEINYSLFHDSQLLELLHNIGLDTTGMTKEELIKNCKLHQDLVVLPGFSVTAPQAGPSTPAEGMETDAADDTTLPEIMEHPQTPIPPLQSTSKSDPAPRPKRTKGKGKQVSNQANDNLSRIEELSAASEQEDFHPQQSTSRKKSSKNCNLPTDDSDPTNLDSLKGIIAEHKDTIIKLNTVFTETNKRVQDLEDEVRTLSAVVKKLVGENVNSPSDSKTRGGRIAARVRFHVETLLGQRTCERILPKPASAEEKQAWMSQESLDLFEFNVEHDLLPSVPEDGDPTFPYKDGPGHTKSTPQQLSVMWQMMQAVGVSSFRPDFSRTQSSKDNKWLWDLGLKIFIKLVECGEYSGVPLGVDGIAAIKKSLKSHIQTLMKRYSQEKWDAAQKEAAANEVRRATRARHLKSQRDRIILANPGLWSLSSILESACSDDETDDDGHLATGSPRSTRPLRVQRLEWRSSQLELIFTRIDDLKDQNDASIPGISPGQRGRPPQMRIRSDDRPPSSIEAPVGLPVDCYSSDWLSSLSGLDRCQLEINEIPQLSTCLTALDALIF
ncbi:uncharacterized protein MELLADRAFT_95434 [Melampsora larici-populina 98AG31]|uniref:Uncharacterized protein n=1 Tax=Melampsora larici-populina (strain 98AG31 / pathotype 3-4-7) TaxID=747676 RepID=F4S9B0_MELLP|nr:uncharacterized protein MELLADRAFT_95434 [Melampsora larici-populina 98AG31]EGF98797.1 hypothetical protein MELLADRAFT_95434 [Melampsora larici-populina 98AG31]